MHVINGHLSCLSRPRGSPSSNRPESVGHHVAYQGTRSACQDPSVGWVVAPTRRVLGHHLRGLRPWLVSLWGRAASYRWEGNSHGLQEGTHRTVEIRLGDKWVAY